MLLGLFSGLEISERKNDYTKVVPLAMQKRMINCACLRHGLGSVKYLSIGQCSLSYCYHISNLYVKVVTIYVVERNSSCHTLSLNVVPRAINISVSIPSYVGIPPC